MATTAVAVASEDYSAQAVAPVEHGSAELSNLFAFFNDPNYMPHGHCYLWQPKLVWLHVVSDIIVALAYFAIPVILVLVLRKRKDVPFKGVIALFAMFIVACGMTHVMSIWTLWNASYWTSGFIKAVTAIVSVLTAIAMMPLLPQFFSMRSPAQLEEINEQLRDEIQKRVQSEKELREANRKALDAVAAKNIFLATVSHEIRTPMNGILGLTSLSLERTEDAEVKENLTYVQSSGQALLSIINDILDLSALESGKLSMQQNNFSLRGLLTEISGIFGAVKNSKNIKLDIQVADDVGDRVQTDSDRLRQLLVNLIGNAMKFTEEGKVSVRLSLKEKLASGQKIHFEVQDSGPGVPVEKRSLLFRAFSQIDQGNNRKHGGTGLGLYISQKIAEALGGSISYREPKEGKGSIFEFDLLLNKEVLADGQAPSEFKGKKEMSADLQNVLRDFKILVAEDNPVNQLVMRKLLETVGARVDICGNGREAVELFEKFKYDIILMDCQMPEMDGYDSTRAIRLLEKAKVDQKTTPILALTADATHGTREKCMKVGMQGYLTKPLSKEDLLREAKDVLARSAQG